MTQFESPEQLIKKGNKARRSMLFLKSPDYEKASTCYQAAAIQFKLQKKYHHAADAYLLAANAFMKLKFDYDQTNSLLEAAKCYALDDQMARSEKTYQQALELLINQNRFSQAGETCLELGKIYEKRGDNQKALAQYELAENYYDAQNKIMMIWELQANLLSIRTIDLTRASQLYVKLATKSSSVFRSRFYYWKAGICLLLKAMLEESGTFLSEAILLIDQFRLGLNTPEYHNLESLTEILTEGDLSQFDCWVANQSQSDQWNVSMYKLLRNEFGKVPSIV